MVNQDHTPAPICMGQEPQTLRSLELNAVFLTWFILLGGAISVPATNGSGTIEVSVRDLSGSPVAGATVYIFQTEHMTGRVPRFKADSAGKFILRNMPPGSYEIHAYKESEGYPDTFFAFFSTDNKKAWRVVHVYADRTTNVVLELGPKYARLKLSIRNESGSVIGASLTFKRVDDPENIFTTAVNGESSLLVPPVPFRFEVAAKGYQVWQSKVLRPRSDETLNLTIQLIRSH